MKKVILFLFLLLAAIGIDYEINSIGLVNLSNENELFLLVAILLLSIYIIPASWLLFRYKNYFAISVYVLSISLFFGCFIPGWVAAYGNEAAKPIIDSVAHESSSLNAWISALTAPLVEETVKGACAVGLIYLLKKQRLSEVFFIGVCVGLGFQILEDISYIVNQAGDSMKEIFPQTLLRISGAISSHWAYTGLFVLGLFCLIHKNSGIPAKKGYLWLLSPIGLHFLWNSPLNEWTIGDLSLISAILTAITLLLIIQVIQYLAQHEVIHEKSE
ncbi:hypothetical protein A5844_000882 [Enterococcus sp. 10A9_DIV0425]|uniref:PrsW family intramembrane metalloprotease n=1 Tax=Candidatus Enterococcus wittei TaxID=1987383 RepID=A0A242JZB9_9ENTE|nr:PrsW family glutamic-type intramembrane protease [Enterococcus sp. 10A9_DIV0425]OTP10748.1 hypothetical protein A5844_000882 [Enterococcus sp. 10A9_DIV0425]